MSYYVEYNPEVKRRYPCKKTRISKAPLVIFGLLFATVGVYTMIRYNLLHYLIPGDSKVTTAAFSEMIESVGNGKAVTEAVFAFCRDIIIGSS